MFHGKMKALTFSYDDGVTQDRRLVELFVRFLETQVADEPRTF